ncbi:hypothetical protein GQ55_9G451400 [Panicum hallii var. hallii]|uniref:BAT2 N-terminal domain-containing protein n=1 Tax=Panicum hallii var. hallii TaxID=1504633 RepID=A0A2T7CBS2_9POAL|nr:hypothetical protein GQ55_9G451400 [Panicum hallii var. hallii]
MSHPGKFVSVNLNRSYGQPAPSSHHGGGGRPSRPAGAGGGPGGGMVVLSRPRGGGSSLAKPQPPKLSVPPPLNLPSLRKEHERFDGAGAAAGGGVASAPPRSGGPAAGWTKPAPASEKPPGSAVLPGGAARPPSYGFVEKTVVLRGEDFPSLKAAVAPPTPPQPAQRQKDTDGARLATPEARPGSLAMRPQVTPSRATEPLASAGGLGAGGRASAERPQKPDLGPLPMVRLRYDSEWADDERDTGLSLPERDSRERGFGRTEAMVPGRDLYGAVREPFKKEPFGRDVAATNKEAVQDGLWRSPMSNQHDRDRTDGRPYSGGRGSSVQLYRESIAAGGSKDMWNNNREPPTRANGQNGVEQFGTTRVGETASDRYGDSSNNWPRLNSFQNNVGSKAQPFATNKGPLINDPVAKFGREKRHTGSPVKPLIEDGGFDSISAVSLTAIKKKKEAAKPADFHDPVRESFEAELDRILRVQEQERQRVMEEQARAREIARKQEEERERLIREEEERQRLVEEQAKQAAWQAEQERLEAARRAEEQRIAREEEKKRIALEEERRREAAHKKLLELEARIARRQAESNIGSARGGQLTVNDELTPGDFKDRDLPRSANFGGRKDIDRISEHINTSAPLESSSVNRYNETVPRVHTLDGHSSLIDRENAYYGSRAAFPEQENAHHSPRRDPFAARRGNFPKKDLNDGFGNVSVRPSSRGQTTDSPWAMEDFRHEKVPQWDGTREIDRFDKQSDFDTELFNSDRFGDAAWLPSSSHESPNAQQGDRMFQSPDFNEFSAFTRPRYSMRQPHVPPPPTVTSVNRSSVGASAQRLNSSFMDGGMGENSGRDDEQIMQGQYGSAYQEASRHRGIRPDHINEHQIEDRKSPVLGSQSSLSVSSPPSSPPHVSHDEMDVSGDSPALPTSADGERTMLSDNDHAVLTLDAASASRIAALGVSHLEDDEWSSENNDVRQKQDEYDEDDESYQEDEINEADGENLDLDDEFLEEQNTPVELEPVILGFDEGVQVEIPSNSELELASMRSTERTIGVHLSSGVAEQDDASGSVVHSDPVTEAEKTLQALTLDRVNALTEDSNGKRSSSLVTPASSSQLPQASSAAAITSSASAVVGQNEVPVSLQFGLFTGPPLIPTPVPAIQIGSIQMPIHLHNQINPSLTHIRPSTTPLYQFGQLRYGRPIAPSAHCQAIPPAYSSVPAQHTLNQNASSVLPELMDQDTHQNVPNQGVSSTFINKSAAPTAKLPLVMGDSNSQYLSTSANNQTAAAEGSHGQVDSQPIGGTTPSERDQDLSLNRNCKPTSDNIESSQFGLEGRVLNGPKAPGAVSAGRGRRYGYAVKDINMRSTGSVVDPSHKDPRGGFQRRTRRNVRRTEFRVRENVEKNQSEASESFAHGEQDERPYSNGTARDFPVRNANRKELDTNKSSRINEGSDHSASFRSTHKAPYERSHGGNKKSRTGAIPEGDTTLLQAGAVRVVKQQGIEVPVDADGFIEVRSKRHIMSVRREQREKENRSKMRMTKAPRKQHNSLQSSVAPNVNKQTATLGGEVAKKVSSDSAITIEGRIADYTESTVANNSMNPIGPPSTSAETHTNCYTNQTIQIQASSDLVTSSPSAKLVSGLSEDNNKGTSINTPFNMVSWDNSQMNQQVMPLTQTQLEEAMRPAKFEQQAGSSFSLESNNALPPTVTTEKAFPSSASPINSLLAGEKIQFGAVTSPTMLPPVSRTVSSGLGAPGSSRPDMKIDRGLPSENSGPDKVNSKELCPNTEDVEAEAEAAASAVAVAAICTDDGSPADATTASAPDNKSFSSKDLSGLTSGGAITGQASQSSTEEPLSVALPADLSVDTPSMSLWPPLASPQASGPMLSQFPGAQPSHFSCFDMNTMLGGHIFAFGPSDESAGSQGQHPQRSNAVPSAPLGAWPQCHSGVDSFYRPPTGFAGPFITPGGIPGVQGPPHMVVYNHFAPVGQFGQMGLGFMGATYIPGDKQPDWKQNQGPPVVGVSQSDPNNQNMVSGQVNPPSVPTPVQHLRPTSIMPIPSPLTMFDIAPFQASTDIQMQTCWPHMPVPPLHSVPLSVPLQQHPVEGTAAQQFVHTVPVDNKASTNNRFQEPSASTVPSDGSKTFPNEAAAQFTDGLGLVEQPTSSSSSSQTVQPSSFGQAGVISNEVSTSAKVMVRATPLKVNPGTVAGVASNPNGCQVTNMPSKTHQSSLSSDQQYHHPVNNQDRRARATQKTGTSNEWQRRSGYQGRNQGSGSDRGPGTGRMKQIYVAKPSATSGHAPSG